MAWILICPECEHRFEAGGDVNLKKDVRCPSCEKVSSPEEYSVLLFCPDCRSKLAIPLDMLQERELQCPQCQTVFSVDTSLSLSRCGSLQNGPHFLCRCRAGNQTTPHA